MNFFFQLGIDRIKFGGMKKTPASTVLIIEDDPDLRELVAEEMAGLGFEIDSADNGETGLEKALSNHYDLVLLDLRMPKLDGIEVCRRVRGAGKKVPIIVLSSKSEVVDRVLLLEIGADDYMVKPFDCAELSARVRAVLRRTNTEASKVEEASEVIYDDLRIDLAKRQVVRGEKSVVLTAREFDILALLASRPGRPFSFDELAEELYEGLTLSYQKSVSNFINGIRRKLEPEQQNPKYILTVRGVGYAFADGSSDW